MKRAAVAALVLALLCSLRLSFTAQGFSVQPDFLVYYNAAALVRMHQSPHIYDDANNGLDPQLRFADPHTLYARVAAGHGVAPMLLFVYPPLLADVMVPFTLIRATPTILPSLVAWRITNTIAAIAAAILLANMLTLGWCGTTLLAAAVLFSGPVSDCIGYGQVAIVLMLLWTGSMLLYARAAHARSALLMAIATAFKLTPLLALLPFLCWREWKWVRWYALGLIGCVGLICFWNGPAVLADYFQNVLPPMAGGIANYTNKTIASSIQVAWLAAHHGITEQSTVPGATVGTLGLHGPAWTVLLAKAVVLALLAGVAAQLAIMGRRLILFDRLLVLSIIGALSAALSPVSWNHAYCAAIPLLVLSWHRVLRPRGSLSWMSLLLLFLLSLELGGFVLDGIAKHLLTGVPRAVTILAAPMLTVLWCSYELQRMRRTVYALG